MCSDDAKLFFYSCEKFVIEILVFYCPFFLFHFRSFTSSRDRYKRCPLTFVKTERNCCAFLHLAFPPLPTGRQALGRGRGGGTWKKKYRVSMSYFVNG